MATEPWRSSIGRQDPSPGKSKPTSLSEVFDDEFDRWHRRTGADTILANPFLKYSQDRRGYLTCEVTPDAWTTNFRTVERLGTPDVPVGTAAKISVAHGVPALTVA